MSYQFEALGDERFQQLCQAILVSTYPHLQCLPVGQPDGGRDAFAQKRAEGTLGEFIAFQVKFVRSPESREARDLIEQVIGSEKLKVERLIARGASAYYLLTNVPGTSHLDVGSVDKVNTALTAAFGIDAYCWWRDDLERRIDGQPALKWSYPEIIRATDLLQVLVEGEQDQEAKRRTDALRSYMAYQAKYDAQLKFKQIDLQKSIVDLFVDVPARVVLPPNADGGAHWADAMDSPELSNMIAGSDSFESDDINENSLEMSLGALQLLAHSDFAHRFTRVVVEGAPAIIYLTQVPSECTMGSVV